MSLLHATSADRASLAEESHNTTLVGKVYLLGGPFATGARSASTYATSTWVGEGSSSYMGTTLLGDVDLDGDGYEDVVIAAPGYDGTRGRAYIEYGPLHAGSVTVGTSTMDAVFTGMAAGDQMGGSMAIVPDMNGDGYDELALGAVGNDDAGATAGKVYVFFGPLSGSYDTTMADITVSGITTGDRCGISVGGVGDIDGDGMGELLVGCDDYSYGGVSSSGAALLYYSGASGDLDVLDADVLLYGTYTADTLGFTVGAAGDFDDDGIPDFYATAYADEYSSGASDAGIVYLVPGDFDNQLVTGSDNYISSSNLGYRVTGAGDVNHDGYDDIAAATYTSGTTAVNFYLGPLSRSSAAIATITSDGSGDYLGTGLDGGGHINSDVYDDTVIGAPYATSGGTAAGEVYVITGRSSPISFTAGTSAFANYWGTASENLGASVSIVSDWDGDGMDDILMGGPGYATSTGRAWLVTAPVSGSAGSVSTYADSSFLSLSSGVSFGAAADGDGDLDGDGYGDVVLGAPGWDSPASNVGAAFVYLGGTNAAFTTSTADAVLTGEATGDAAGTQVAILGDTNDDGYDDLLVGAPSTDVAATSAGTVYVVLGPVLSDLTLSAADTRLDGAASGEGLGTFLDGAGDLDGDGYDDWIAGSSLSDRSFSDAGTSYVVYGPLTGVDAPHMWHGPLSSSYAGAVAGAGDTDNDGYDDVIVGGYGSSKVWVFEGP